MKNYVEEEGEGKGERSLKWGARAGVRGASGSHSRVAGSLAIWANNLCFLPNSNFTYFRKKRNFCLVICRKEGNKLCQLSGRMLLLASTPSTYSYLLLLLFTLSHSLLRDSFGGTFAKWLDACLEYIFIFAKKAMRVRAKLFEQGRAFAHSSWFSPTFSVFACLPHPPDMYVAPFGCICTYCRCGILRLKFMGNCLPTNTESGILCFLKFNVTVFADVGGGGERCVCAVCCVYSTKFCASTHTCISTRSSPSQGTEKVQFESTVSFPVPCPVTALCEGFNVNFGAFVWFFIRLT